MWCLCLMNIPLAITTKWFDFSKNNTERSHLRSLWVLSWSVASPALGSMLIDHLSLHCTPEPLSDLSSNSVSNKNRQEHPYINRSFLQICFFFLVASIWLSNAHSRHDLPTDSSKFFFKVFWMFPEYRMNLKCSLAFWVNTKFGETVHCTVASPPLAFLLKSETSHHVQSGILCLQHSWFISITWKWKYSLFHLNSGCLSIFPHLRNISSNV